MKSRPPTIEIWEQIPAERQKKILTSTICPTCKMVVPLIHVKIAVIDNELTLTAFCANCKKKLKRLVEI